MPGCSLRSNAVRFYEIDSDEWDTVMAVNARGSFEFAKAVVPHMRDQGYGKIINIASARSSRAAPG